MMKLLSLVAVVVFTSSVIVGRAEAPKAGDGAAETKPAAAPARAKGPHVLDSVPQGYCLHAYDDCGVPERQPHVQMKDSYLFTLPTNATKADLKSRSAVFNWKAVEMLYTDLDPKLSYVLAVTYANDHVYKRVQSLWANGEQLHEPFAIPKSAAVRLVVEVPQSVTKTGRMALQFRLHGEANVTVSIVELWVNAPAKQTLRICEAFGLYPFVTGKILDMTYEPVAGAAVKIFARGQSSPLFDVKSGADGSFMIPRGDWKNPPPKSGLRIVATIDGRAETLELPAAQLFEPIRYRPLPSQVGGLSRFKVSLNGTWKIHPTPAQNLRTSPLDAVEWKEMKVPGQWRQQGFDLSRDQTVAMAKEFSIPPEWAGRRIFLRFDAIHAGTHYWLNGRPLGYSENLFTPVEWEITELARIGEKNRLDLEMKVNTVSEMLSVSSDYVFHNLGGIDRSVSVFALPKLHVRSLKVATDLDREYRDAELKLAVTLDNPSPSPVDGLSLEVSLQGPDGKPAEHAVSKVELTPAEAGESTREIVTQVKNPLKWNAEKPHLYKLILALKRNGELIERIERNVGFRKIEVRGARFLVNGVAVKLCGAIHHEMDPLTCRADTGRLADQDVRLYKTANLNYLRTTHYPPTSELIDAADKYGLYVEVEAPFCWVAPYDDLKYLREVLVPTSAMVDCYDSHPSVMLWSLANESTFNRSFEVSNQMVKQLDPTRPTTFNNPDPKRICDLGNTHYPPMPYDEQEKDDPRPLLLGEYFFPVCHEQTDVRIDPGLRAFYGFGHSNPESAFGRKAAESFTKPFLKPCIPPGAWSHIVHSQRVMGAGICGAFDESFYFSDGTHAGYAWHHGYWGLMDAWRRPKPEWWMAKMIFAPVWFPTRQVEYAVGQPTVSLPVENRYSFTDLSETKLTWQIGAKKGKMATSVAPGKFGKIDIPVPQGTPEGTKLVLWAHDAKGDLITGASIQLGRATEKPLPQPEAGAPRVQDDGKTALVEGNGFALVFDEKSGDFNAADPRHRSPITRFPSLHVTRYDFGDLAGPNSEPYAVFPDEKTKVVDRVTVQFRREGVEVKVNEHFAGFAGATTWLIDKNGMGKVSYDYVYSGKDMNTREAGIRFELTPACDELSWRRWSEWGDIFPKDSISRTEGTAKAFRTGKPGVDREGVRPTWPWSQDQTELGTADFRSIKFNVYEASLRAGDGAGLRIHSNADAHVRCCLADDGVLLYALSRCPLGQVVIKKGDRLAGEFVVEIVSRNRQREREMSHR